MPTVKTAVSVDETLLRRAESLARSLRTSRSGLFALALAEFLKRHDSQRMLEEINAAYVTEDSSEKETREAAQRLVSEVADEW